MLKTTITKSRLFPKAYFLILYKQEIRVHTCLIFQCNRKRRPEEIISTPYDTLSCRVLATCQLCSDFTLSESLRVIQRKVLEFGMNEMECKISFYLLTRSYKITGSVYKFCLSCMNFVINT